MAKMKCPHCDDADAVFEAVEEVKIKPVISSWKFDEGANQLQRSGLEFVCISCQRIVKLNFTLEMISAVDSEPVWDDTVEAILEKARTLPETFASGKVVKVLREKRYLNINDLMTGKDIVREIIRQRP